MSLEMTTYESGSSCESWPKDQHGNDWDGRDLLSLVEMGGNPFKGSWDLSDLVKEVESCLRAPVVAIPLVTCGRYHFGFHMKIQDKPNIVARLSRGDVRDPASLSSKEYVRNEAYRGIFELDTCKVLEVACEYHIRCPIYHRDGLVQGPNAAVSRGISGRRVCIFECTPGEIYDNSRWWNLRPRHKMDLLKQAAGIGARIFLYGLPLPYVNKWLHEKMFFHDKETAAQLLPAIEPTRYFCLMFLTTKLAIKVKPFKGSAMFTPARDAVMRILPRLFPQAPLVDERMFYRFVADPKDYGIRNMNIGTDSEGTPWILSVFDWEDVDIVPAILADPTMITATTLCLDEHGKPNFRGREKGKLFDSDEVYHLWAEDYFNPFLENVPEFRHIISAGFGVRQLHKMVNEWNGEEPDGFFNNLMEWAREMEECLDTQEHLQWGATREESRAR